MKKKAISASQLARLHEAIALQNQGRLDDADAIYADFLRKVPGHPDALHLRALICHTRGRHADAARFAEAAIAAAPDVANFHNTAGEAWRQLGDLARARRHFNSAVRLAPGLAMAHHNLSLVLAADGLAAEALAASQRAVALDARYVEALALSLELARQLGNGDVVERARAQLRTCDNALARNAIARFHTLAARDHVQALRFADGAAEAEKAIAASPGFWGGWSLLGEACNEVQDLARAELYDTIAANLAPDNENARLNLAHLLKEQQRIGEAESHYRAWLARHPDNAEARFGLAGALLMRGAYAEGWPLFEARWDLPYHGGAKYAAAPQWTGESTGRLLLYAEQGLGDTLQMLRFLPAAVRRAGAAVTLLLPPPLARIARRAPGAEALEIVTSIPEDRTFDAACGLMSLPGILGLAAPADAATSSPYLGHNAARAAHFASRLAAHPGRKLGIVWLGGQAGSANRRRRLPEDALLPLLTMPGWTAVSLQFGVAQPEIAGQALVDLSDDIADFDDLAAAMTAVDAVVSLDSGPAHLAGALGVPTWILVPWLHDWRWGLGGERCDWYPAATLVRQPVGGRWDAPIAGLVARLGGDADAPLSGNTAVDTAGIILRNEFPLVQARCRDGIVTLPLFDRYITLSLLLYGEYSPREAAVLAAWLRPGDTAIDVGANLGALTLAMAHAVGEDGRVIAFEPQAAIHACLAQTLADSALTQVELQRRAVDASTGHARIPRLDPASAANFGGVSLADDGEGDEVELVRLDDLDVAACRLLKIDVEGRELDVLRGAVALIARCRPVIHVECDRPDRLAPLLAFLREQGYRVVRHEPPLFDAANFRNCPHDAFPRIVSGNLIALPPGEEPPPDARPA
ncbi:FkbM family methyltransferase [Aromatoleum toluvorans]|uniref:FkbM family methyltransferase n=1 Tax=Aromatoleum toluvorans TaxID=92002 RepID=A0ABX1Q643_9RHOO|nr:FkbM family methyltransferase [Aromatoleum toluvorans]NMG46342.1 FkbM family methyltransferase [Aromatoleum toluvorans]